MFPSTYNICRVFIMIVKSLVYRDQGCCLDVSLRCSGYTICSKPDNAMGKEITQQCTSEDTQIREVQLQGFVSDKAEHLLYSRSPTSQVHDPATAYGSFQSGTCSLSLSLSLSVVSLFLNLPARAFTMLPKLSSSFSPVSFCKVQA